MIKKSGKLKNFNQLTAALLTFLVAGIATVSTKTSIAAQQQATILKIVDGDTVEVQMAGCRLPLNGQTQICRIQLACIDTPETEYSVLFQQSKNRLSALLPPGKTITIRDTGTDSHNRIVAEIFANNQSINLQMVQEGQAAIFCQHLNNCAGTKTAYINAQNSAQQKGLGIWNPQQTWPKAKPCAG